MGYGLKLSQQVFEEIVFPAISRCAGEMLPHLCVGFFGPGSDILGHDDEYSRDHEWGPWCRILFDGTSSNEDMLCFEESVGSALPESFHGFAMRASNGRPKIRFQRLDDYLKRHLNVNRLPPFSDEEWLIIPEQRLLEFTRGEIFYDPAGVLNRLREELSYFPRNVWLSRMAYAWSVVGMDSCMLERIGRRKHRVSVGLHWASFAEAAIRLTFLLSRRYAPAYKKWMHRELELITGIGLRVVRILDLGFQSPDWKYQSDLVWELYQLLYETTAEVLKDELERRGLQMPPIARDYHYAGELPLNHRFIAGRIFECVEGPLSEREPGTPDQWMNRRELVPPLSRSRVGASAEASFRDYQIFLPKIKDENYGSHAWTDQIFQMSAGDPWGQDWRASQIVRHRESLSILTRFLSKSPPASILELGCATGVFTRRLDSTFPSAELYALDIADRAIQSTIRAVPRAVVARADLPAFPREWSSYRFDLVVGMEVLVYLSGPVLKQTLMNLTNRLSPNGSLLLSFNLKWNNDITGVFWTKLVSEYFEIRSIEYLYLKKYLEAEKILRDSCRQLSSVIDENCTELAAFASKYEQSVFEILSDERLTSFATATDENRSHIVIVAQPYTDSKGVR